MRPSTSTATLLALAAAASAKLQYLGVAMSGIDFGCDIDGTCPLKTVALPLKNYGGADGKAQMEHFVKDDKLNIFRLPVSWQFLTNAKGGSDLDPQGWESYDTLMQTCFDTGAYCMIDLHNFARFDKGIIGQGGPSDATFARLWANIAAKYKDNDRVVFGLMNEPHDLDTAKWADTCQAAVTAIRKAGAKTQAILLPGNNFSSAADFVANGSAELLSKITNPDGSTDGLLLDLHKYLDINNSGQHSECTTDNVEGFGTIATWLRANNRTAMVSETGASMEDSCMEKFCAQNRFINNNTDVFVGFVGWSAGSFDGTYVMSLTPTGSAGAYTDNKLMQQCILDVFKGKLSPPPSSSSSSARPPASSTTESGAQKTSSSVFFENSSTPSRKPADGAAARLSRSGALALVAAAAFCLTAF
ncbi:glycoside hydrolase family GH5 [Cordyceps fumosorosea ARSEF 2679]|uniref:Endoglucanase EG-II n=1 Tax=Cordyceps fumosorosea (strain ARSEF 2679) TaxID=1081104 RepID=A0A168E3U7_CORFA|nr:glycoside hydrolase family GH5 [Cordyceps fumosorosea ARSEF 2679]OAA73343.1 glycoside hydrolase family GH5 [Cordyceps fumosorosea ARSEF 2679]